ncbi:DNA pilot protein [robinz microvirus RP_110]|nr:DNA pilot protein [robinz microvirus RP_110]
MPLPSFIGETLMVPHRYLKIFGIDDAILGAGVGLLGGFVNNIFAGDRQSDQQSFNAQQQFLAQGFNSAEAQKQRDFTNAYGGQVANFNAAQSDLNRQFQAGQIQKAQDYATGMSNTQWQRGVSDMRAAGINPILAAAKGGGASAPVVGAASGSAASGVGGGGASASSGAASSGQAQVFDMVQPMLSSALAVQNLKNLQAENERTKDSSMLIRKQAITETNRPENISEETEKTKRQRKILESEQADADLRAVKARSESMWEDSAAGRAARATKQGVSVGTDILNDLVGGATGLKGLLRGQRSRSTTETSRSDGGPSTFSERFDHRY